MPQRHTPNGRDSLTRPKANRLGLETLEDRTLLSASPPLLDLSSLFVTSSYAQDHILVRFEPGQAAAPLAGTTLGHALAGLSGLYKVQLGSGMSVTQAIVAYRHDPRVQLAEPDYRLGTSALPDDPRLADQWAVRNTGQDGGKAGADLDLADAWKVTTGSTRMVVSVMDTGIDYTHPDLYQNVWLNQAEIPASRLRNLRDVDGDGLITFRDLNNPVNIGPGKITDLNGNGYIDAGDVLAPMVKDAWGRDTGRGGWADGISEDGDTAHIDDLVGWNFVNNTNDPMDDFGHGTHVAGIIGATGNNGVGVTGINWNVQLMPIKFMNATGAGTISDFIEGLNYAVAHGARISNNSWTGATFSTSLLDAIQAAQAKGHIFVAAAGNYGGNNDNSPEYPAGFKLDNVVSVTATDRNDKLASFSNYGANSVTLAAPGVDILSTTLGGGYGFNSGTSMATPQVTGVMALVWSAHPSWTYSQVIRQVTSTVDKVPALAGKTITGGRLNAGAALGGGQEATPASTPPRITAAVPGGPSANTLSKVRVTFDRAMALSTFQKAAVHLVGPGGRVIAIAGVKVVAGSGDRTFEVTFAAQTAAGTYTMRIGPEVMDLRWVKMAIWTGTFRINQTAPAPKPPPAPAPVMTRTYTSTVRANVRPLGQAVSLLTISDNITIADLNVKVNVTHPRLSDLVIHLESPTGMDIVLFNRMGGPTANLVNTVFDDQAKLSIAVGRAPFTGSFQPAVPLATFFGQSAKGTWKLWVEDRGGQNSGTLTSWSLIVRPKV
jgi:subtilisin family serine protease/subtilisin-like proprotein convertase family protein